MKPHEAVMKKFTVFALILTLAVAAAGCDGVQEDKWSNPEFSVSQKRSGEILDVRLMDAGESAWYEQYWEPLTRTTSRFTDDNGNLITEFPISTNTIIWKDSVISLKDSITGNTRVLLKDEGDKDYSFRFVIDETRFVFWADGGYYIYDISDDDIYKLPSDNIFYESIEEYLEKSVKQSGCFYGFDLTSYIYDGDTRAGGTFHFQSGKYYAFNLSDYSLEERYFNLEIKDKGRYHYPAISPDYKKIIVCEFISDKTAVPANVNVHVLDLETGKIIDSRELVFDAPYINDMEIAIECFVHWISNSQFVVTRGSTGELREDGGYPSEYTPLYEFDLLP